MEAKFFSEIEKSMDIKTLKDFEKELRTKINQDFESIRKTNTSLSRVLMAGESELWNDIKEGQKYHWVTIKSSKKNKLFRLIDIYSKLDDLIDDVKEVNKSVAKIKELKDAPEDKE